MGETTYTPGPRQTVDRAKHPTLGDGILVCDNGPCFFKADSGEVVPCRQWLEKGSKHILVLTSSGDRVRLDVAGMERGPRHCRRWHPVHGPGWHVFGGREGDRWEADSGLVMPLDWVESRVGRPGPKSKKTQGELAEDEHWWTMTLRHGEVFMYRDEPPPSAPPAVVAPPAAAQMDMFAGSR